MCERRTPLLLAFLGFILKSRWHFKGLGPVGGWKPGGPATWGYGHGCREGCGPTGKTAGVSVWCEISGFRVLMAKTG